MSRYSLMVLVIGHFICSALAQLCGDDDLDLCHDLPGSPELFTCDSDEMDLCVETVCDADDLDLCDDETSTACDNDELDLCDNETSTVCDTDDLDLCDDEASTTSSAGPGGVTSSTTSGTAPQMIVRRGSFTVKVDATAPQVKSSTERALGQLLFDQGVGSSAPEAAGYVTAEVETARRLGEIARFLASTVYSVTYIISIPDVAGVSANVDVALNAIKADPTTLQAEMVNQFAAANVASATTVTISNFQVSQAEPSFTTTESITSTTSTVKAIETTESAEDSNDLSAGTIILIFLVVLVVVLVAGVCVYYLWKNARVWSRKEKIEPEVPQKPLSIQELEPKEDRVEEATQLDPKEDQVEETTHANTSQQGARKEIFWLDTPEPDVDEVKSIANPHQLKLPYPISASDRWNVEQSCVGRVDLDTHPAFRAQQLQGDIGKTKIIVKL